MMIGASEVHCQYHGFHPILIDQKVKCFSLYMETLLSVILSNLTMFMQYRFSTATIGFSSNSQQNAAMTFGPCVRLEVFPRS